MKFFISTIISGMLIFYFAACTSTKETSKTDKDDNGNYVFDEIPFEDSTHLDLPDDDLVYDYFVQIGAFTTMHNAENFAAESKKILNEELVVEHSDKTNLYIVRLKRIFGVRSEAIKTRNELWKIDKFNDAWIFKRYK